MAEVAGLFVFLIVIYASECAVWTRPHDWIFCGVRRGHWRVHHGPKFTVGDKGGVTFVGVIPLLPTYFLIRPKDNGLSGHQNEALKPHKAPSLASGEFSFSTGAAKKRVEKLEEESLLVRFVGDLLFLMIFLLLPVTLWTGAIVAHWRIMLVLFVYLWLLGVGGFFVAHRRLFPDQTKERLKRTLLVGISPLGAIRAANQLSKDLLRDFHPLVACYILCSEADFERNARMAYYDEASRVDGFSAEASSGIARPSRLESDPRILEFLKSVECHEWLAAPPERESSLSHGYCPRCHCQYRAGFKTCADCSGVLLVAFK